MTTRKITSALRAHGLTTTTSWPKNDALANEWPDVQLLGGYCLNVCGVLNRLGFGCYFHQNYAATRLALCECVEAVLNELGVKFVKSLPDQYLLKF